VDELRVGNSTVRASEFGRVGARFWDRVKLVKLARLGDKNVEMVIKFISRSTSLRTCREVEIPDFAKR